MIKAIKELSLNPDVTYIKIHGLQRCGTNYLLYLINENFEKSKCLVNLGGWKHGHYIAEWAVGHEVDVICITKTPYSWLVSVYDYWHNIEKDIGPKIRGVPFKDFVRNRLYCEKQGSVPYILRASNPVQHWNNMNYHWMSIRMQSKSLFVLRYESLISNTKSCLEAISEQFKIKMKNEFRDSKNCFNPSNESPKLADVEWNRQKYQKEKYLEMYDQDTFDFVNEQLDLDLMIKLNYEYKGIK